MNSNIDWSLLITKAMKDQQAAEAQLVVDTARETEWRTVELLLAADQLLAIEDDDPNRLPGTEREWRDYRIAVRSWKEGVDGFPNIDNRPKRPERYQA